MEPISKILERYRQMRYNPSSRTPYPIMECHGCAHEAAFDCENLNKHRPSGEMPCIVCIRNPDLNYEVMNEVISVNPEMKELDDALHFPADMYVTLDWLKIFDIHLKNVEKKEGNA